MGELDISTEYPAELSGRYVLEGLLASGGMATVHLAKDKALGRKVALKLPHPHLWKDPRARERFLQEARLVASLAHENVMRLFDVGEDAGRMYLAMELVEGQALDAVCGHVGPFPALAAMELARQLFAGLQEAHSKGISHRDIKPSNLLLDRNGNLKIADFGLSRLSQSESTGMSGGGFAGTPRYASPELADGKALTSQSDLFSTGLVLVEILLGKPLVPGDDAHASLLAVSREDFSKKAALALSESRPEIPPVLQDLCVELLRRDPAKRPTAGEAFLRIESFALAHQLRLGKQRLAGLPEAFEALSREEAKDLSGFWRASSEKEKAAGHAATARKHALLAGGEKSIPKPPKRFPIKTGLMVFLAAVILWALLFNRKKADDSPPVAAADTVASTDTVAVKPPEIVVPIPPVVPSVIPPIKNISKPNAVKKFPAWLRIFSRPPHAEIWVDGVLRGTTPLTQPLQIDAGTHALRLVKAGCLPREEKVELKAGDTLEIRRELERKP